MDDWDLEATTRYVVTERATGTFLTQLTVTTPVERDDNLEADVTVINLGLAIWA